MNRSRWSSDWTPRNMLAKYGLRSGFEVGEAVTEDHAADDNALWKPDSIFAECGDEWSGWSVGSGDERAATDEIRAVRLGRSCGARNHRSGSESERARQHAEHENAVEESGGEEGRSGMVRKTRAEADDDNGGADNLLYRGRNVLFGDSELEWIRRGIRTEFDDCVHPSL